MTVIKSKEEAKMKSIQVCPECGCRVVVWNEHDTYGYFLCYGCGWSSMTPGEIGVAMAKAASQKLKLELRI